MKRKKPWFIQCPKHPFARTRDRLPTRLRVAVIERQNGQCACCGCLLGPDFTEIDHHPPLALRLDRDAPHDPAGLQALCSVCHEQKTARDLRQIAKAKRQAILEEKHRALIALKVPGRPRPPASVRRWRLRCQKER
ncbi:MAG: HNH endonuclease [Phreatobacter sp.]|uniref:HNH endonuclease n=1 Tax=Phreatobacter sp. TaxID=1966341 RepID=UPI001A3F57D1|nr:HNH endonuclease [Phreatobacter sp.]